MESIRLKIGAWPFIQRALVFSLCYLLSAPILAHQGQSPKLLKQPFQAKRAADTLVVDAIDPEKLLEQDQIKTNKLNNVGPVRYALPFTVHATTNSHGSWSSVAGGRVWRLQINAPGATDLNFGFNKFNMPQGATLHIYSPLNGYFQGPYTKTHQQGQLWTPVIPGSIGIIELYVPSTVEYSPTLELTHIGRGYRNLFSLGLSNAMKQGGCNNDVICSVGDPWSNQIQSVAVYGTNGSTFCTGTLLNNIEQDGKPYFVTANHCGITSSNAASVVAYWNFESPTCGQLGGGTLSDNTSGATFRASDYENDMTLIELNSVPDSSYNVFYAGWDARSSTNPLGSVGIHHPNTDEKAISFNDDPLTTTNSCIGTGGSNTHWLVDNWESGTTEPGSSGSGLFDPNSQLLVGYLSGGSASCENPSGLDCYGKISVGWGRGLQQWLDPNTTGVQFVVGMDGPGGPPGVIELQNNETVSDLEGDAGDWHFFKIYVPTGATDLSVTMFGGSGDADLYTRFGSEPTLSDYDCRPYLSEPDEVCLVETPTEGEYYIGINGYTSFSGVTLSVSYSVEFCLPIIGGKGAITVICL